MARLKTFSLWCTDRNSSGNGHITQPSKQTCLVQFREEGREGGTRIGEKTTLRNGRAYYTPTVRRSQIV